MANGEKSESVLGPMALAAGGAILVLAMMAAIVAIKPLDFSPPRACAEGACEHEGGAASREPEGTSHEHAPPAAHAPEGTSHATTPPAEHGE
jgi:hypothetical protein